VASRRTNRHSRDAWRARRQGGPGRPSPGLGAGRLRPPRKSNEDRCPKQCTSTSRSEEPGRIAVVSNAAPSQPTSRHSNALHGRRPGEPSDARGFRTDLATTPAPTITFRLHGPMGPHSPPEPRGEGRIRHARWISARPEHQNAPWYPRKARVLG
jgi:hypothetical protein